MEELGTVHHGPLPVVSKRRQQQLEESLILRRLAINKYNVPIADSG